MIKNTEDIARDILTQLGTNQTTYVGFEYIIFGIRLMTEDVECLNPITKLMYMDIASRYHTSWKCVEKNIRKVICVLWKSSNQQLLFRIFGRTCTGKPSNREFFQILFEYITQLQREALYSKNCSDFICPKLNQKCEIIYKFFEMHDFPETEKSDIRSSNEEGF